MVESREVRQVQAEYAVREREREAMQAERRGVRGRPRQ